MHLYEHTKYFHTDVEPLFLNSSNCFIKVLIDNETVNVGLSKYYSFCMSDLKLNEEQLSIIVL